MRVIRWRDTLKHVVIGVAMSLVGFIVARIHMHVFDRLFLRYGRLERFGERGGDGNRIDGDDG